MFRRFTGNKEEAIADDEADDDSFAD